MPRLLKELGRRKVLRAAALYVAVAWGATEIFTFLFERFGFPDWTIRLIAALFVAGFPVAMFLEWTFDIGADGVRHTPPGSPQGRLAIAAAAVLLIGGTTGLMYLIRPAAHPALPDAQEIAFTPPARSIAVLPFEIFAAEGNELEWLGDGFAETLLHYLSQVDSLQVTARTSAFSFKDRDVGIRQIGRALNVATVLEGSLQKSGETLRITAQLIDTRDGTHLWSQVYHRPSTNLFDVQDEIAKVVVAKLLDALTAAPPPVRRTTSSPKAYELYLLGRHHWHKRSAEAIQTAIGYFQQAIHYDPGYALAWSGLADSYSVLPDYTPAEFAEMDDAASSAARTAIQLAPDLAEGHASMGLVHMRLSEYEDAEAAFEQAIALNTNYAMAHHWRGRALALRGRFTAALQHHRRALTLDPLAPVINLNLGLDLTYRGSYDQAIERFERAMELSPDMANAYWGAAVAHHHRGALAESAHWFDRTFERNPAIAPPMYQAALLYLDLGDDARADRLLESAQKVDESGWGNYYARRLFFLSRGRQEELVQLADSLLDAEPDLPFNLATAGLAYSFTGDCATALAHYERLQPSDLPSGVLFDQWDVWYGNSPAVAVLDCQLRLGRTAAAEALLGRIEKFRAMLTSDGLGGSRVHYFDAQVAAVQGQLEPAMAHLTLAVEAGWRQYRRAQHDPAMDALRRDPRFAALMTGVADRIRLEREQIQAAIR